MLVLARNTGEKILIGNDIVITVVRTAKDSVRIGIEAPPRITILREELRSIARAKDAANAEQPSK